MILVFCILYLTKILSRSYALLLGLVNSSFFETAFIFFSENYETSFERFENIHPITIAVVGVFYRISVFSKFLAWAQVGLLPKIVS